MNFLFSKGQETGTPSGRRRIRTAEGFRLPTWLQYEPAHLPVPVGLRQGLALPGSGVGRVNSQSGEHRVPCLIVSFLEAAPILHQPTTSSSHAGLWGPSHLLWALGGPELFLMPPRAHDRVCRLRPPWESHSPTMSRLHGSKNWSYAQPQLAQKHQDPPLPQRPAILTAWQRESGATPYSWGSPSLTSQAKCLWTWLRYQDLQE